MRRRNCAIMMGRVRLNSKRAAFSISSAKEGSGAREREDAAVVAAMRAADLREGSLGREMWNLGLVVVVVVVVVVGGREGEEVIRVLVEAMIMLAMAVWYESGMDGWMDGVQILVVGCEDCGG